MKNSMIAFFCALIFMTSAGSAQPQQSIRGPDDRLLPATPPQMEGPYYPVSKPKDQDNDLTRLGSGPLSEGPILVLSGRVVDRRGRPLKDTVIELWQPDRNGIYMHPGDSRFDQRDKAFQFFGKATSDDAGRFAFRTILPGIYGSRPRHFHVRVLQPGGKALTTQLYFKGDERLARDFLTRRLGDRLTALLLEPQPAGNNEQSAEALLVME